MSTTISQENFDFDVEDEDQENLIPRKSLILSVRTLLFFLNLNVRIMWQGPRVVLEFLNAHSEKLSVSALYPELFPQIITPETIELRKNALEMYILIVFFFQILANHPDPDSDIHIQKSLEIALTWGIIVEGKNISMTPECTRIMLLQEYPKNPITKDYLLELEKEIFKNLGDTDLLERFEDYIPIRSRTERLVKL